VGAPCASPLAAPLHQSRPPSPHRQSGTAYHHRQKLQIYRYRQTSSEKPSLHTIVLNLLQGAYNSGKPGKLEEFHFAKFASTLCLHTHTPLNRVPGGLLYDAVIQFHNDDDDCHAFKEWHSF